MRYKFMRQRLSHVTRINNLMQKFVTLGHSFLSSQRISISITQEQGEFKEIYVYFMYLIEEIQQSIM